jgi:hypothetical protein
MDWLSRLEVAGRSDVDVEVESSEWERAEG